MPHTSDQKPVRSRRRALAARRNRQGAGAGARAIGALVQSRRGQSQRRKLRKKNPVRENDRTDIKRGGLSEADRED